MNRELSAVFEQIADLMEIQGADPFRINSYRRVARSLKDLAGDVTQMCREGRLTEIAGVGKGQAERIKQYLETGKITVHEELKAQVPAGLPALLGIPGMGPKKVALAWKQLGVENVDDLKAAIESGQLAALPGMGTQSVKKIAAGLAFLEKSSGRTPLGVAWPVAHDVADRILKLPGVKRVEVAGSLRRGKETVGDVDLLCECARGKKTVEAFTQFDVVRSVLASGATKGSVTVEVPGGGELQVDLRVVPAASFGAALQYFTGSKEHNVRLRELAIKKKWKLNEYGLFDGDTQIAGKTEKSIYAKLKAPFVGPELREDRGEFDADAAARSADLVTLEDIRGDLHMHTVASDGRCTIEEMARAAKEMGYQYIGICEHSKSSAIANGLSIERMEQHIRDIREADKRMKGLKVLVGTEVDILSSGKLDYPDDLLAECDLVVASIHSGLSQDRKKVTARTLAAMENPYVTMIGHPSGRLLGKREPMDVDWGAIIAKAAETGTMLELNASWQRLDVKDVHARQAVEAGVMLCICTDAHHYDQLGQMVYGVMTARRGWAGKDLVLNTRSCAQLGKLLRRKRS
ncbi:MAG: DNA polymerase/3'-5' exonuclease PolX [Phycisphaerales bacterium]|nr:MAG: DNA polymerase/3'-5' exonuclease PolX [Phycisphaerales bacterium]